MTPTRKSVQFQRDNMARRLSHIYEDNAIHFIQLQWNIYLLFAALLYFIHDDFIARKEQTWI